LYLQSFTDKPIDIRIVDRLQSADLVDTLRAIVAGDIELAAVQLLNRPNAIDNRSVQLLSVYVLSRLHRYEQVVAICQTIDSPLTRLTYLHIYALYSMQALDQASTMLLDSCNGQVDLLSVECQLLYAMIVSDRGETTRAWDVLNSLASSNNGCSSAALYYVQARLYRSG
jgi:hypothetical protein